MSDNSKRLEEENARLRASLEKMREYMRTRADQGGSSSGALARRVAEFIDAALSPASPPAERPQSTKEDAMPNDELKEGWTEAQAIRNLQHRVTKLEAHAEKPPPTDAEVTAALLHWSETRPNKVAGDSNLVTGEAFRAGAAWERSRR